MNKIFHTTNLGDVVVSMKNGIYKPANVYADDGVACLRMYNIEAGDIVWRDIKRMRLSEEEVSDYRLLPGDLLVNRVNSRELVGKSAVIPEWQEPVVFESKNIRVRLDTMVALPKFINYQLLLNGTNHFSQNAQQVVGMASISQKQISEFPVVLPTIAQQTRIVAEIEKQFSRLDEAVANLKRVKANLKRYKAAVLKAAVEGKLTEEWRKQHPDVEPAGKLLERILAERRKGAVKGKYKEPVGPDTSGLPELPEGWVWVSIGDVFDVCVGATPSRGNAEYWNGSVPWVSSGEVAFCRIRSTREKITDLGLKNTSTKLHPTGTILLGMIGEGKTRGQVAILDIEACNNQNSAAIRVVDTEIISEYLYSFLEQEYERTRLRGSGGNQPALNKSRVEQILFSLPPVAEQRQIVAEIGRRLSTVAETESQVDANLRRADRLRQSILKQAFSGQLVPQDPNDEPASALLVRNGVGAIHESPGLQPYRNSRPRKNTAGGAIRELPLQTSSAESDFSSLDSVLAAILNRMQPGREYSRAQITDPLGLSTGRWNAAIQELKRRGRVRQVGERRGARYLKP